MKEIVGYALSVFFGFFAIMNPIANTPIFLGLTANDTPDERKRVARKALMLAFGLVVVFALLGKLIFSLFGITLPAFQITGGVLVALIGYEMLKGEQSVVHQPCANDPKSSMKATLSIAVTPLAMPILAAREPLPRP